MAHHVEDLSSEAKPVSRVGNVMHDRVGQASNHIQRYKIVALKVMTLLRKRSARARAELVCAIAPCMGYHGAIS